MFKMNLKYFRLFLWNSSYTSLEFPLEDDFSEDTVSLWVMKNLRQTSKWLSPPGGKSGTLAPYINTSPVLIVFTPGHPLLPVIPVFSLVRELSLDYFNCDRNPWTSKIGQQLKTFNRGLQSKIQRQELTCSRLRQAKKWRAPTFVPNQARVSNY